MPNKIKLGVKAKDVITGFSGTVTACTEYITGCRRYCLEGKEGSAIKEYWFDESRLEATTIQQLVRKIIPAAAPAGPPSSEARRTGK